MEKVSEYSGRLELLNDYLPFNGLEEEDLLNRKWEVVYFLYPFCNGTCSHCWSSDTFLGRVMPLDWHQNFWKKVNPKRLEEVKVTGGEPFLYKEIGLVVESIRESIGDDVPITIFTSGRPFVSLKSGEEGAAETLNNLVKSGVVQKNVEIHLSADEHHAGALYRTINKVPTSDSAEEIRKMCTLGEPLLVNAVKNFMTACEALVKQTNGEFKGGKLKIHVEKGRTDYHQKEMYKWIDDKTWEEKVICSEGIIKAGSAEKLKDTIELEPNPQISLFILPGAEFFSKPVSQSAQKYRYDEKTASNVYLDKAENGRGASIIGWWNIISKNFCGGSANDALQLIGYSE